MIGHYFNRSETENVLYIPGNVIIFEEKGEFDINYSPNSIQLVDQTWKINPAEILGDNLEKCIIRDLDISDGYIKKFQDFCWENGPINIVNAHTYAVRLFYAVQKEIKIPRNMET